MLRTDSQRRAMFAKLKNMPHGETKMRIDMIDKLVGSRNLNDFQKEKLLREKQELIIDSNAEFAKAPKKIPQELGSVWVGGKYVHGPRIRQPNEFEFVKNVDPSPKFFHIQGAEEIPESLPRGSKLVVGKLNKNGEWALQSTLIPKESKLGKELLRG